MSERLKEIHRVTLLEIVQGSFYSIEAYCIGKNVIHNPNVVRIDDVKTGDMVFYKRRTQCQ